MIKIKPIILFCPASAAFHVPNNELILLRKTSKKECLSDDKNSLLKNPIAFLVIKKLCRSSKIIRGKNTNNNPNANTKKIFTLNLFLKTKNKEIKIPKKNKNPNIISKSIIRPTMTPKNKDIDLRTFFPSKANV